MLLTGYTKRIFRPECNPGFESVHCIAALNEDVTEALPYLNAELGGTQYFVDPPAVMFHVYGKIIKVGGKEIAVNALKDEAEADKILQWLKTEINRVWDSREIITPSYESRKRPQVLTVLKMLPMTNCGKCGYPTCMVFAVHVSEGGRTPDECPAITPEKLDHLENYLSDFNLE